MHTISDDLLPFIVCRYNYNGLLIDLATRMNSDCGLE